MAGLIGVPETINDFNMYAGSTRLVGIAGSVSMPDIEALTETIPGTGILGEYDATSTGRYGTIEFPIPFRCLDPDFFTLIDPTEPLMITLRGAVQYAVKSTGSADYIGMRVIARGKPKNISIGTIEQGKPTESSITIEATYFMVELDGKPKFELDKINGVCKVNNKDLLAKIKQLI